MPRNWAGTYEYTEPRIVETTTENDVSRRLSQPRRDRAQGTTQTLNHKPETTATLVDVKRLADEEEQEEDLERCE